MIGAYADDDNGSAQARPMCMCAVMACGVSSKNSPPVMVRDDYFGFSVSISGDTAVIGA